MDQNKKQEMEQAYGVPAGMLLGNAMFAGALKEHLPGRQQFWPDTDRTNQFLKEMCESHPRLHFMDATDVMLAAEGEADCITPDGRYFRRDYFRMDQIHLNVAGHNAWMALMKEMLEKLQITA